MAGLDFVSDLKPFKSMWKIRVKVIRLWKQYTCVLGETMEMVLADSKVSTLLTTYIFDHFETLLMLLIYLAGRYDPCYCEERIGQPVRDLNQSR